MSRYEGKPLLRLLELYVLWCIEELSSNDAEVLGRMTPKLQQTYARTGTWFEVIESVMDLPVAARQEIAMRWDKERRASLSPQAFAEKFVDENLT